jgi:hypothetical protein
VIVRFRADEPIDAVRAADAFMTIDEIATVRVSSDGNTAVYRADVGADTAEGAVPGALSPAQSVAARLQAEHWLLGLTIEEDDETVTTLTGRRVVLYSEPERRSTTTRPSSTDTG